MDPDIENRTDIFDRHRNRASRAPWDPPPRPSKPLNPHRGAAAKGGRPREPNIFGLDDDNLGRGAD